MKEKLARGVVWLGFAKVLVNILALCSTFVLARLLTPEDFGLVAIATTILSVIGPITELSLSSALIQHKQPTAAHYHTAWTLNVLRAILVTVLFVVMAPWVAGYYSDERLELVMFAIGLSVLIGGFTNPRVAALTRNLEFMPSFILAVSQKLFGFVVGVGLALAYESYWALLGGTLASQAAGVIASYVVAPHKPKICVSEARELWSFSVWLTLGQTVNTLNWRLDHLMVGSMLGPKPLGTYVVGDNLASLPTREASGPIEQALFPGFSAVRHDRDALIRVYLRAQALICSAVLPLGFGVSLVADKLVPLALGNQWGDAIIIVQVLACVFALQTLGNTVQPLAMAEGATKLMFQRDLFSFAMRVPIIFLGMWFGGMVGVVYARFVTGCLAILINMFLVRRLIGVSIVYQFMNCIRSLVSVAVMSVAVILFTRYVSAGDSISGGLLHLLVVSVLGATIYVLSHLTMWRISGAPVGPESEFMAYGRKILDKLKIV